MTVGLKWVLCLSGSECLWKTAERQAKLVDRCNWYKKKVPKKKKGPNLLVTDQSENCQSLVTD